MTAPPPRHLGPEYGAQFSDPSVVRAYPTRPPDPDEVHAILADLAARSSPIVLDLGCGLGDVARRAAAWAERVDAVDPSAAMLEAARAAPGGVPC